MYNPVQMWNYGELQNKNGLTEKARLFTDMSFAVLEISREEVGL